MSEIRLQLTQDAEETVRQGTIPIYQKLIRWDCRASVSS